jgi:hypothetical protein
MSKNRCDFCKQKRSTCPALQSTGRKPDAKEIERREIACNDHWKGEK